MKYRTSLILYFLLGVSSAVAQIASVTNAASFVQNTTLTPGSIITIKGTSLTNSTAQAPNPSLPPKTLAGVTLTIGGVASSIFYVSPTQINAQIDPTVTTGLRPLVLVSPTGTKNTTVAVENAGAPGIFTLSGSGAGDGAVINAVTFELSPFSVTTGGSPTYLAIYATGLDLSSAPQVTIGGVAVPVQFYGNAPGFLGLQQINVQLLASLAGAGRVGVRVRAGGKTSNIVEITILPSAGQVTSMPTEENEARH
ncbi:MAG: IPT/TIG domain-containing protein, partial [Bryobacteraceae bacterium]